MEERGTSVTKFNKGRPRPEVQPLTRRIYHFGRKGTPFIYLLLKYVTPSQKYFRKSSSYFHVVLNK